MSGCPATRAVADRGWPRRLRSLGARRGPPLGAVAVLGAAGVVGLTGWVAADRSGRRRYDMVPVFSL